MNPPRAKKARTAGSHLKISNFDAPYQFVNNYFDLMVFVQDAKEKMKTGGEDLPLKLSLVFEDTQGPIGRPELLQVDPRTPAVIKNGRATISVQLTDVSMNEGNRRFCILVEAEDPRADVGAATSDPITVITHRLKVPGGLVWEEEWFKDEGGRDKCITVHVELRDARNQLVKSRRVPLTVTLLYQSGQEVGRQDILKIGPESDLVVENGKASIKARIDEVSRSHQNQAFKIKVAPDASKNPLDNDISPVCSPLVTVRSKRNNKKRRAESARNQQQQQQQLASPQPAVSGRGMDPGMMSPGSVRAGDAPYAAHMASASAGPPAAAGSMPEALTNVLGWISNVLTTFQSIKWVPIGVERIDGMPVEQSRGLYSMKNPNEDVDKVLSVYKNEVMHSLHLILSHLEPMLNSDGDEEQADPRAAAAAPPADAAAAAAAAAAASAGPAGSMGMIAEAAAVHAAEPLTLSGIDVGDDSMPLMPGSITRLHSSKYLGDVPEGSAPSYAPLGRVPRPQETARIERDVTFIVAKVLVMANKKIGFPAFNAARDLIGFYRESEPDGLTQVTFIPLQHARMEGILGDESMSLGSESLEREIQKGSKSVFKIEDFKSDLTKMKEGALMYYWMKSTSTDEPLELGPDFFFEA